MRYYRNFLGQLKEVHTYWDEQAYLAQNPELPAWAIDFTCLGEWYA